MIVAKERLIQREVSSVGVVKPPRGGILRFGVLQRLQNNLSGPQVIPSVDVIIQGNVCYPIKGRRCRIGRNLPRLQ